MFVLPVELDKQTYCDLKVANKTEHHVAFKVKTTSPKKYFVRPNTGIIQPWDSCVITVKFLQIRFLTVHGVIKLLFWCEVTLQAQRQYPPDMQCKDKFLLQSTIVPPNTDVDEMPQDTFNKDGGKPLEECKLKVVYISPTSGQGNGNSDEEQSASRNSARSLDANSLNAVQRLKEEKDAAVFQSHQLQQELVGMHPVSNEMLRRRRHRSIDPGFSLIFAAFVGLIGIMVGFLLNLTFSVPSTE
ncbi:hypothetical protein GIB67_012473 [Kingdonia uniflora]|uniref:MSP domain-containing protein n=1 Tax=Kingdonia uniflora TaxID=39325 RepID=A0A7J7MVN0_9MAGN|nr:hypothetical protein GIB67_012473 [Kingdonia uniflora]